MTAQRESMSPYPFDQARDQERMRLTTLELGLE